MKIFKNRMGVRTIKNTHKLMRKFIIVTAILLVFTMGMGIMPVFAEDESVDAIAITVIIPPLPERPAPVTETRRLFPVNVAEGYNYEGVRQLVRVYELLPDERPEWINTDSFERNGYYYQIADIVRRVDISHTVREHTEIIEIHTERNDLAAVIAGLDPAMEFIDEDGYAGILHLDIRSIEMTQDGTRSTSRTVSQTREFPHLSNPDISLLPQTVTVNGRIYTLANVNWQTNTSTAVDFNSIAQTFTANATYTRTAISTVSTGYTTRAEYNGTLTRVSTGDTRFVATFIGTPIVSPIVSRQSGTPSSPPEQGQATDGGGYGNGSNGSTNGENQEQSATPIYTPENNVAEGGYEAPNGSNEQSTAGYTGITPPPADDGQNGATENRSMANILIFLGFILALAVIAVLIAVLLRNKKKEAHLEEELREAYAGHSDFADYAGGPGRTSRPRSRREPKSWEKADALRSRMETIVDKDRSELGRGGGRYVKNYHAASPLDADDDEDFSDSAGYFGDGHDPDFDFVEVDGDGDEEADFHDSKTGAVLPGMETSAGKDKQEAGRHGDGRLGKNYRSKAGNAGKTAFMDATFDDAETDEEIPDEGLPDNNFDYETAAREATKKLLKVGDEDG